MTAAPERFDVAVVGGGSAGVAAAVTAARAGARTLLVERGERLGGNATAALVHTICGLYHPATDARPVPAHRGFPARFARALAGADGAAPPERAGRVWVLPTSPPAFAACAARACAGAAGLAWHTDTALTGVALGPRARHAELALEAADARRRVEARIVVDASGEGAAGALAGADVAMAAPGELQLPSFIFRMAGVDTREIHGFGRLRISHAVAGATRFGTLPGGCESILVRPAARADEVYVTLNVPRPADRPYAPLDPACLAALEAGARAAAETVARFLRASRPAFARGRIVEWPARIGVRETRRLLGTVELAPDDVLTGRRRPDEVALSTWPIELWHDHRRPELRYPEASCSVPLGALVSRSHPRLGMAGRCLSATHEALGALRVIATAMATGEAVGAAAALAADRGLTLADVPPANVRALVAALADEPDPA